jgi:hypothetical protein
MRTSQLAGVRLLLAAAACSLGPSARAEFIHPRKATDPLVYGVKNGIVVAVHPAALDARPDGGPRGLIRVGYKEGGKYYLINYVAIEPLVGGSRGFSELEKGGDGKPGKRFWVGDDIKDGGVGKPGNVSGRVRITPSGRVLTFAVHVEPFHNGARPIVEVSLFERFPERVRFRTFSGPGGKAMAQCVLTATMGNQSRCRWLWLKSAAVFAPRLYEGYEGTDFVEKKSYPLSELHRTVAGDVVAAICPNESEPREVWPLSSGAWHHDGKWMAQFWLKPKGTETAGLHCRVNGRRTYWAGDTPIPGGISYENFELREEFRPGSEVWFGYTTASPAKAFGFPYDASPQAAGSRMIPKAEQPQIAAAARAGRGLTNGDFRAGLDGWQLEGKAAGFRIFRLEKEPALSTYGSNKDADTGRVYQCFKVPADGSALRFYLHGGSDGERVYVALWRGERPWRRMTARNDNTPFEVRWDVRPLRGEVVTLEVVDRSTRPWGFIGVHGFALLRDKGR